MGPGNRPLDLDWLEDFLALAETGNFSRAAQARAIAQPAFSRHIRSLEEWVGLELVDRSTHPASLTPAGHSFRPEVVNLLQQLEQARRKARAAQDDAGRSLRLAATHVLSMTFFPAWLARLEAQLQLGRIEMVSDSFQACEEHMLQRRQHFLLGHGHPAVATRLDESRFEWTRVAEDRLLPVAAPGAAGEPLWRIAPDSGAPVPVLAYSQESGLGQIVREALPAAFDARRFTPVFTSHHAVLLKTMALEGRGIAWLPRSLIEPELASGRLCPAAEGDWQLPIDIRLYRERAPLPEAAEALWGLVRGHVTAA